MRVDKNKKAKALKKKRRIFLFLIIVSLVVLGYTCNYIVHWFFDSKNIEKEIADIEQIVSVSEVDVPVEDENVVTYSEENEPETSPYWSYISMDMLTVDFSNLKSENSDTVFTAANVNAFVRLQKVTLGEINKEGIRKMTPREWARLQGFPDTFNLPLADVHLYKQFGNSVTVNVIEAIAKQIKEVDT